MHLGQSRNCRQVRPVPSTKANPKPPYDNISTMLNKQVPRIPNKDNKTDMDMDMDMDMVFRFKAIRPFMNKKTGL